MVAKQEVEANRQAACQFRPWEFAVPSDHFETGTMNTVTRFVAGAAIIGDPGRPAAQDRCAAKFLNKQPCRWRELAYSFCGGCKRRRPCFSFRLARQQGSICCLIR